MSNELKGFQLLLKIISKGKYDEGKSGDGQFTGGFSSECWVIGDTEYHVEYDQNVLYSITKKRFIPQTSTLFNQKATVYWPVYDTLWSNE